MRFPFYVARRYFFSKKKRNFITVISRISMGGVAIGSMALIIVLSVFNGLEELLRTLYGTFDPEIKIEISEGKTFEITEELLEKVRSVPGINRVTESAEDFVYITYKNAEYAAILKGVSADFINEEKFESAVVNGEFKLKEDDINFAIVGKGIQYALGMDPANLFEPLQLHYVRNAPSGAAIDPSRLIHKRSILPAGYFALEKQIDETYIIVPLEFALELFDFSSRRTALELRLLEDANIREVQSQLKSKLGPTFKILNSDEQHATLLRTVRIEKLFVFIIFTFIIAIASFNIFFSLSMLAIDKKKDISILYSMGANDSIIRRIFLTEGAMIALSGASIGLILGAVITWIQQNYGIISMGMQTSVLEDYPVKMKITDFIYTGASIVVITFLSSFRPALIATRYASLKSLHN
jgi:lipoprotein-releasing system permease protein